MIRYTILENGTQSGPTEELKELERRVKKCRPKWLSRAQKRLDKFKAAKKYDEKSAIWSEIKSVYETVQGSRCAYCECDLRGVSDRDKDIEHFRPKALVKPWQPEDKTLAQIITNSTEEEGYYMLSYCLQNYLLSCTRCNEDLKCNYFPIRGIRSPGTTERVDACQDEQPLLIYPLGTLDDDPDDHFDYFGMMLLEKSDRGRAHIKMFRLDDDPLCLQRARDLLLLWMFPGAKTEKSMTGHERALHRLREQDPARAQAVYEEVENYYLTNERKSQ